MNFHHFIHLLIISTKRQVQSVTVQSVLYISRKTIEQKCCWLIAIFPPKEAYICRTNHLSSLNNLPSAQ